jgi:hypothetical protein
MGAVWLARHETLDKDVAVKILPQGVTNDPEAVSRFLREAKAAARLEHPNVVQVLDAGTDGETHFIVMQFVDGTDLEKTVKKRGPLAVADALAVGKRVALALAAAHQMGIVHRDIKPANILLTKQGRVMVADFGLARDIKGGATITATEEAIGTPHYLAPEQARGEKVDGRSDLYSLGGTLYTLLSGKTPFTGASPVAIAMKHANAEDKPPPLCGLVPNLPEEVQALVDTLMAKKPEDRFQTGEQVAAAIDVIKSGPASIGTAAHPKVRPSGKKWGLLLAGGAALAGVLLFAVLTGSSNASQAEEALRSAGAAPTDGDKISRYRSVAQRYPGTPWADEAQSQVVRLRRGLLERELLEVKAMAFDGKVPFREVMGRMDKIRSTYPEGVRGIDAMEAELDRARVIARSKELAEALRARRSDDKPDRLKELIAPETLKKAGEGWVLAAVRAATGALPGSGFRVEEAEIVAERMTLEVRKSAHVPVKLTAWSAKSKERSVHKLTVRWLFQEGDWYLAPSAIQEEK